MADIEALGLVRLVYVSSAKVPFTKDALLALLKKARARNEAAGLTGILLHDKGSFLQVLEGLARSVELVFDRIGLDPRHHRVAKLFEERGVSRAFADWSMGQVDVTPRELMTIPGCNDFFRGGRCYADLSSGMAKNVLEAFREGRFRSRIG